MHIINFKSSMDTLFERACTIIQKGQLNNDVGINLGNDKYFYADLRILKQLEFFRNVLMDNRDLPQHNNIPIIFEVDTEITFFITKISISFLYRRLCNRYMGCRGFNEKPLSDFDSQVNYIRTLDYLSNPDERKNLTDDIDWTDAFWITLVKLQFKNLDKFYFSDNTLCKGWMICNELLNTNNSRDLIKELNTLLLSGGTVVYNIWCDGGNNKYHIAHE